MPSPEGVTQLLEAWSNGDESARDALMIVVYAELRRLADSYLRRERPDHTLQPTALVHEAYLRLSGQDHTRWQNREQFFGVAAEMMRRILVDHARRANRHKRGGTEAYKLSLSEADRLTTDSDVDLVMLDEALNKLAAIDEKRSRLVELRFFGGLTISETAKILNISTATAERDWRVARAFLRREIGAA